MPLIDIEIDKVIDKVQIAIKRLKTFEPEAGYFLAFSGGKDSQVIYELAKMSGVKFDAHYNLTTVDPPELVKFIKTNYPDVIINKPKKTMWKLIANETIPPTRRARYCCEDLKETGGIGRVVVTGIRWQESANRSKRKMVEHCRKYKSRRFLNPIIDWTTDEVWEFIKLKKIEYCSLYDEGFKRIGCIMCPLQGKKGMLIDAERYPTYYKMYLLTFEKMLRTIKERNVKRDDWKTPNDVMKWWIYGKENNTENPDQCLIFE